MRIVPNEFNVAAETPHHRRAEAISIDAPLLIAFSPVLLAWCVGLSVAVGATWVAGGTKRLLLSSR